LRLYIEQAERPKLPKLRNEVAGLYNTKEDNVEVPRLRAHDAF
jgi:hypothetical protein